jgi:curved DNA-binding protein CbpA
LKDSLYDLLEVSPKARQAVIKAAYRCLVQQYHPDKKTGEEDTHDHMTLINHAYSVLSDPLLRDQYDLKTQQQGPADRRGKRAEKPQTPRTDASSKPKLRPFAFRPFE